MMPKKKADVLNGPDRTVEHVGLLFKRPPSVAGLPFIKSSNDFYLVTLTGQSRECKRILPPFQKAGYHRHGNPGEFMN